MKRALASLLIPALLLAAVSCGSDNYHQDLPAPVGPAEEPGDPEDPGTPVDETPWDPTPTIDFTALGGTSKKIVDGVEWTSFHGKWEG